MKLLDFAPSPVKITLTPSNDLIANRNTQSPSSLKQLLRFQDPLHPTFFGHPICHPHHHTICRQLQFPCQYPEEQPLPRHPLLAESAQTNDSSNNEPQLSLHRPLFGATPFQFSIIHPLLLLPTKSIPTILVQSPPETETISLSGIKDCVLTVSWL